MKYKRSYTDRTFPAIVCGSWEGLLKERRMNLLREGAEQRFINMHSEEFVKKLNDSGITVFMTHFFKGFGIELLEIKEEFMLLKKLIPICHRYGIKVGGYIGNGLVIETLKLEQLDCEDWLMLDKDGKFIPYSWKHTMRFMGCRNNPEYLKFIFKVCKLGIKDIGFDILHFDHVCIPDNACYCKYCRKDFKSYLKKKFPCKSDRREVLGYSDWKFVEPPLFDVKSGWGFVFDDPLVIQWTMFQALRFSENMGKIVKYIKGLSSLAEVAFNFSVINSHPGGQIIKVELDSMLANDITYFYDESGGPFTAVSDAGGIRSHLRSLKVAQSTGKKVLHYTCEQYPAITYRLDENHTIPYNFEQKLAEALVLNVNCLGVVSCLQFDEFGMSNFTGLIKKYSFFLLTHQDIYQDWTSLNKVAVWRSDESMLIGGGEVHLPMCLIEQALIDQCVPFDIIFDKKLDAIKNYKVLIIAGGEVIDENQERLISDYVFSGNSLVLVGYSGAYNKLHQILAVPRFSKLIGLSVPYNSEKVCWYKCGRGRVLFIPPKIISGDVKYWLSRYRDMTKPPIYHENWKSPDNLKNMKQWLRKLDGDSIQVDIKGAGRLFCDVRYHPIINTVGIHLLRYIEKENRTKNINVSVKLSGYLAGRGYSSFSFITPEKKEVKGEVKNNRFALSTPSFYGGVIILK